MDGWVEGGREADIGKEDYVQHSSSIVVDLCCDEIRRAVREMPGSTICIPQLLGDLQNGGGVAH